MVATAIVLFANSKYGAFGNGEIVENILHFASQMAKDFKFALLEESGGTYAA